MNNIITARTIAATSIKGTRVKADSPGKKHKAVTIGWDYSKDAAGNHNLAVRAFLKANKMGDEWRGSWSDNTSLRSQWYSLSLFPDDQNFYITNLD